jgi:hypothetical protein
MVLPIKTELERDQEARLAQHLAADQLAHQIDQLQQFWNGTGDPKYMRQQTRVFLSLARLGVIPGTIDSLAANVVPSFPEGQDAAETTPGKPSSTSESAPVAESISPQSAACNLQSELAPAPQQETWNSELETTCCPPPGACSPSAASPPLPLAAPLPLTTATPSSANTSADQLLITQDDIDGLRLLEQRLLTLLAELPSNDSEKHASLEQTLHKIQTEQAILQLRVSPNLPGATLDLAPHPLDPNPSTPVLHPTEN